MLFIDFMHKNPHFKKCYFQPYSNTKQVTYLFELSFYQKL